MTEEPEMGLGRDEASHINLRLDPSSSQATALTQELTATLWATAGKASATPTAKFGKAVGAIVGGLLKTAAKGREEYCYRQMGRSTFGDERMAYDLFKAVTDGLYARGYIRILRGNGGGNLVGFATRFRATPSLLRLADGYGIDLGRFNEHYRAAPRPTALKAPIALKSASRRRFGKKLDGVPIPVDFSRPDVAKLAEQVNAINAFLATVAICPDDAHYAFRRVFNQGDLPDFDWNRGGRLISLGDSYQQLPSSERRKMKLDGEPVVEIDLRASHLTILHALLGLHFDAAGADPYEVPDVPRDVVKAWVTMTLGHDSFQRCWSAKVKEKYKDKTGGNLQKDYPVKVVREKVLNALPVLRDWPHCTIRWGKLQYEESCIIIDTVYRLAMEYGVTALPVHDSIIVPVSRQSLAETTVCEEFHNRLGAKPRLSVK
jgi:hypothetical protein